MNNNKMNIEQTECKNIGCSPNGSRYRPNAGRCQYDDDLPGFIKARIRPPRQKRSTFKRRL
jgi:hypothetical protein